MITAKGEHQLGSDELKDKDAPVKGNADFTVKARKVAHGEEGTTKCDQQTCKISHQSARQMDARPTITATQYHQCDIFILIKWS